MESTLDHASISEPVLCRNGLVKMCKILGSDGDIISWDSRELTGTPFIPSSYDSKEKGTKTNLELTCTNEYLKFFKSLDQWCIEYLVNHSKRLLGGDRTYDWVGNMYKPCVKHSGSFNPLLRTKIVNEGMDVTRYWTPDKRPRAEPEMWTACTLRTRIRVAYLYISETGCGIALECSDIQVCSEPKPAVCPF